MTTHLDKASEAARALRALLYDRDDHGEAADLTEAIVRHLQGARAETIADLKRERLRLDITIAKAQRVTPEVARLSAGVHKATSDLLPASDFDEAPEVAS